MLLNGVSVAHRDRCVSLSPSVRVPYTFYQCVSGSSVLVAVGRGGLHWRGMTVVGQSQVRCLNNIACPS